MEYDYLHRIVTVQEIADQPVSMGYWLARLFRYGRNYYDHALSPYHLDTRHLSFLNILLREDGLTIRETSEKLAVNEAVTRRALNSLADLGYVQRQDSGEGVFLTQKARDISTDVRGVLQTWSEKLVEDFTDEEKELALRLLKRMNSNAIGFLQQADYAVSPS
jgi:DNA-binding MarR family transcriptional regulator